MRKVQSARRLLAAAIGAGLLCLGGCGVKLGEEFTGEVNILEGVAVQTQEGTVSPTGITLEINNQSDKDLNYGQDYSLQKEKDGRWYQVEPESPVAVTLELLWIPAGSTQEMEVRWEASYGKLPEGHYRIVKSFADEEKGYYLAGEFSL
ncbi:hypothetical protein IMSAGC019_03516 [Lachnospiraceae bacterium]|nr:hypothetical protein IMSAGC019_03516 [Lachnospiraceae bacterium]